MNDDDDDDIIEIDTVIDFKYQFSLIRLIGDSFYPTKLTIRTAMTPEAEDETNFDVALMKIKFWLETIVPRSIAFSHNNPAAASILFDEHGKNRTGNLMMLCPDEPTDLHLAPVIQSKLNALAGGRVSFQSTEISSETQGNLTNGLIYTFIGDPLDILPTPQKWLGERNYFTKAWWDRDDGSMMDVTPNPQADLSKTPLWAINLDFLGQTLKPQAEEPVILRPEFRPVVIDGGVKDE